MAGNEVRRRVAAKQRIPRIRAAEATKLLEECDRFFAASGNLLGDLQRPGIAGLLRALNERILLLAVQPDAWGERTRARLMSALAPALADDDSDDSALSIEDIVRISNSALPCFLLEIGRRRQHIHIEFPVNPAEPDAIFSFAPEPLRDAHSVSREQLLKLMNVAGEEMVGLCYFGDEESRSRIEAYFAQTTRARSCRTLSSVNRPQ